MKKSLLIAVSVAGFLVSLSFAVDPGPAAKPIVAAVVPADDYTRVLNERAAKILAALTFTDVAKSNRVHTLLVQQYRDLSAVHQVRDAAIAAAKAAGANNSEAAKAAVQAAREEARPKLDKLHGDFLRKLGGELATEQIEKIKDGMTYGVLPLTYGVYLKMYPELTEAQKQQIKDWLTEARELAMDGSTSDEKHGIFGKYKGRINNYLSKAGYDAKKAEQNLKKLAPVAPGSNAK